MTWSITAAGEIKDIAGKALEDLERELFDAIGPVLTRFGAYASNFAGHHITGAPHQTTSDAAATVTTTTGTVTGEDQDSELRAAPMVPVDEAEDVQEADAGRWIESDPDPADVLTPLGAAEPDPASIPAPSAPVDPPAADIPLPAAEDTGAAATT